MGLSIGAGLVVSLFLILATCNFDGMTESEQLKHYELAAIRDVEAINKAQASFHDRPTSRYATTLRELCGFPNESGAPSKWAEIVGPICRGEAHGYVFTLASGDPKSYAVAARPKTPGSSGRRFFYSDQTMIIHQSEDGPATANSPQVK
jgi:hypothetical protein